MRLGIVCPGQGEQLPAMFDLLPKDGPAPEVLRLASGILGDDLQTLSADRLAVNAIAQPALCAFQLAAWSALRDKLPVPCLFAGYSIGELSCYGCAGSLTLIELIELARMRAAAMDGACQDLTGLLAVSGLTRPQIDRLCAGKGVEIAIINDYDRFVVGGRLEDLSALEPAFAGIGAKLTRLPITVASHTSLMTNATSQFRAALTESNFRSPAVPVLAGIDGGVVDARDRAIDVLTRQLTHTIDWAANIDGFAEMGCTVILELGPGSKISAMIRKRLPQMPVRSVSEFRSLAGAADWVTRTG